MNSIAKNREKLQNTKKIKDTVIRFNIFILSFIFLLMSFNFSFAVDNSWLSNLYVPNFNSIPSTFDTNTYIINGTSTLYPCANGEDVYSFFYPYNSAYMLCYVSESSGLSGNEIYHTSSYTGYNRGSGGYSINSFNSEYNLYYTSNLGTFSSDAVENSNIPIFDSLLSAFDSFINRNNFTIRYPYTFQNGYLFVYDLGNTGAMYSFDLTSKSEEYSNLGDFPFPDTNQSYWFSNSLPEIDETTIPDSNATIIHWLKGDKQNIFGQTQDMIATISGTSTGRYIYIYNPPAHYNWVGNSNPTASETINYPVTINGVSSGDNFYIYDSVARLADYNQGGKVQGTVGMVGYGSVASDGAITVTTSDGAIYNQVSGGSTDISGANGGSIAENINGLKQTLDDFVNQFIQLLSAPISHIQQLIQSSHQFFDVFSQLFEWLPSELSSVIVSGLIIMVVIGVIKMLL